MKRNSWIVGLVVVAAISLLQFVTSLRIRQEEIPPAREAVTQVLPGSIVAYYTRPLTTSDSLLIASMFNGLELVAHRSTLAAQKMRWIKKCGAPATLSANGDTIIPVDNADTSHSIWLIPFGAAEHVGAGPATMAAGYVARIRAIVFTNTEFSPLVKGLLFAHELHHADDHINRGVNFDPSNELSRVLEERSAYRFVHDLLTEYTRGRWLEVVNSSFMARDAWKRGNGLPWQNFTFDDPGDTAYIIKVLPEVKSVDFGILTTQLAIDANLKLIDSVAASNNEIKENGEITYLRRYFKMLQEGQVVL